MAMEDMAAVLESLLPYTERHYQRLARLQQVRRVLGARFPFYPRVGVVGNACTYYYTILCLANLKLDTSVVVE